MKLLCILLATVAAAAPTLLFRTYLPFVLVGRIGCDVAYPTVCIPSPPPDLDCGDITFRNFTVLAPDPHRFDMDGDGIGCETRPWGQWQ